MKQLDEYKEQLLKAAFLEAKFKPYCFFRRETDKTAFIINLAETECGIDILYGFCSTSSYPEYKEFFEKWGKGKDDCNLRYYTSIVSNEDESKAKELIEGLYILYHNTEKDDLLSVVKERRKTFLHRFTELLKPIGFKKKGNKWIKQFADEYILTFEAQKSDYSDQYYFNIEIGKIESTCYGGCYYTRVVTNSEGIYNWQLMCDTEIESLLTEIEEKINNILNTSIEILGKQKWIWEHCNCSRNRCDNCWVEKNRWEAKEFKN